MHLMLPIAFDVGTAWEIGTGTIGVLIAATVAIASLISFIRGRRRKLLTYEISDTGIINSRKDLGQNIQLLLDGRVANFMRLLLIKITNAGIAAIDIPDYQILVLDKDLRPTVRHALQLDFGEHEIIRYAVHDTEPPTLFDQTILNNLLVPNGPNQLLFQGVTLNAKKALTLKVLCLKDQPPGTTTQLADLSDKEREVKFQIKGEIKDGKIEEYTPPPPRITSGRLKRVGLILLFFAAIVVGVKELGIAPLVFGQCGIGSIQDGGSTAFYSTALQEAQIYHSTCILGPIDVSESNSHDGLVALENGQLQIANSELVSPYPNLQDHQIAAIVFALIINKHVMGITNLSTSQIQRIYNGGYKTWNQVSASAPPLPITVLERPSGSGTLASLIKYVLNGKNPQPTQTVNVPDSTADVVSQVASTSGAIGYVALSATAAGNNKISILDIDGQAPGAASVESGQYQYWAIEHMYTEPNPRGSVSSFISLVSRDLQTGATFIRLSDLSPALLQTR
jgi:phosphate transport system substrate-binding protein